MIFLTSDHGGWRLKQRLNTYLQAKKFEVTDLGPRRLSLRDDYPVWAGRLARRVRRSPGSLGIAVCRSGVGMAMVANKFPGIRATQAFNSTMARQSRRDEDANVLSLAADYQSWPQIQKIVSSWLSATYRPIRRYQRRLREIKKIESDAT